MPIPFGVSPGLLLLPAAAKPSLAAAAARAAAIAATAGQVSLRPSRQVFDQSSVPCCVSCALSGAMEVLHSDWPSLAPLFHYYVARGGTGRGGSMEIEDGRDVLASTGVCRQVLHPYPIREEYVRTEPSFSAFADAFERRLRRVGLRLPIFAIEGTSRVAEIRKRLQNGSPVLLGFRRPSRFPDGVLNFRYEWTDPPAGPSPHVGHCILVTGFSDARLALRVQDSEGAERFDHGGWWMGYRVADSAVVEKAFYLSR